jgi:hypothetical protein
VTVPTDTNHVQLCKPFPEHIQLHAQIVKELKQRDEHDKIQGRETAKRSLQSGEPNDAVDVELFSKNARLVVPFKKVRTREEVDFQWARAAVSAGLPVLHQDPTWWCQGNHDATPHLFHYQTHPKTRQFHRSQEQGEDEGNDTRVGSWKKKFETKEGNAFTGPMTKANESGEKTFTVDGKEFDVEEELIGGQKKLDKNDNGKIDGEDFKILKGQKQDTKEEEEECDECGGSGRENCNRCEDGSVECDDCGGRCGIAN